MKIPESIARVLDSRGIRGDALQKFLAPAAWSEVERPENIPGLETVVSRLQVAIQSNHPIGIFADYDCDGILSAAILHAALKIVGANISIVLPTREEGYGLNEKAVRRFAKEGKRLIVTVDNGIMAHEPISLADRLGIDTVVIDHHTRSEDEPAASAILWDDRYCAAALAFLVSWGLLIEMRGEEKAERTAKSLARLAAIAMIADCVPLVAEARTLTKYGLQSLSEAQHPGLREMLRIAGVAPGLPPSSRQIGYMLAPMVNSASRLSSPVEALEVLLESNPERAVKKVANLDALNKRRRDLQDVLCAEMLKNKPTGNVFVAFRESWPRGMVGIMAARAVEHFGVPAFVLGLDTKTGRAVGSARSVSGFNLVEAMNSCSELLDRFGGHAAAAGLEIELERLDAFRNALNNYAKKVTVVRQAFEPEAVLPLAEIGREFYQTLRAMEPFGNGNEHPRFQIKGVQLVQNKAWASLLRNGVREVEVRHPKDARLVFTNAPHDYLVEATPNYLILRGVSV